MRRRRRRGEGFARWLVVAAVLVLLAIAFVTRRLLEYAADPTGEKDCPPPGGSTPLGPEGNPIASSPPVPWVPGPGTINDASCLNRTPVYGVVAVRDVEDVRNALAYARAHGLEVSVAGVRHSMGGQAFAPGAMVLDMTRFNRLTLDAEQKVLTAQSGATWHDIQNLLHPKLAVTAMQSTDVFTVGGSISVNAHGMDHRAGSVGRTVCAMRVMLADGSIRTVSREQDAELFRLIVGGYGLFGVILDADLELTDNAVYRAERRILDYREFPRFYRDEIQPNERIRLMYGHLATAPPRLLGEMIVYTYTTVDAPDATIPPLGEVSGVKLRRLVFNLAKHGTLPMRLKWLAEKHLEPRLESCPVSRNQAQREGEACLVSRNQPMHDSVRYLKNVLPDETDVLHEYFVPADRLVPFVDGLRRIVLQQRAPLLNASVRVVHAEDNLLTYAPTDMFAVVLYLNQRTDAEGAARMERLTRALVDLCAEQGGRFFLPYQLHYSAEQLRRAYPEIGAFFRAKLEHDPERLFTSTFYEKYASLAGR